MIPSTELRLQSMLRSMAESIVPALDACDALAREQAKLVMGHLHVLLQQQGQEAAVRRGEEEALRELATHLLDAAEGGPLTAQAIEELRRALAGGDGSALSRSTEQLLRATDASDAFKANAWRHTLAFGRASAVRGRQWFAAMGF